MNTLRKAILVAATGTFLAIGSTHASAEVLLSSSGTGGGAQSWNGNNNGYLGWGHTVDWFTFQATDVGTIDVKMTGNTISVQPAFTVWNSGNSENIWSYGHTFSQISNEAVGTFVGFSNNYGTDNHFGHGPGANAQAGTVASFGVDLNGNQYAELVFSNLQAGTWYALAAGNSGGSAQGFTITANLSAVPVPGAIWLFGSAIAGLVGVSKRKKRTV